MIARVVRSAWFWALALVAVAAAVAFVGPALLLHSRASGEAGGPPISEAHGAVVPADAAATMAAASRSMLHASEERSLQPQMAPQIRRRRRLARSASVSLIVGNVDHALAGLTSLASSQGGDVVKLSDERPAKPGERHTAQVTLSIPETAFDATLKRLAGLGGVRSQSIAAEDLSDQLIDSSARLRNLRRTEADLLRIMDRSGRIGDVLDVENQLADVRDRIERLDAETHALSARVTFATIDVALEDEAPVAVAEPSSRSQLSAAWSAAWHASRAAALALVARGFFVLAFAPYWLGLLALGALLVTQTRRRLRADAR